MEIELNSTQKKFSVNEDLFFKYSRNNLFIFFDILGEISFFEIKENLNKILKNEPILRSHYSVKHRKYIYNGKVKLKNLKYMKKINNKKIFKKMKDGRFKINHKYHFYIIYNYNCEDNRTKIFLNIDHNICDGISLIYFFHSLIAGKNNFNLIKSLVSKGDVEYWRRKKIQHYNFNEKGIVDSHEISIPNFSYISYINFNINKVISRLVLKLYESSNFFLKKFVVKEVFKFSHKYRINNEIDFYLYEILKKNISLDEIIDLRKSAKSNFIPYWDLVSELKKESYAGLYGLANIEINYRARFKGINNFNNFNYAINLNDEALNIPEGDISLIVDQVDNFNFYLKILFNRSVFPRDIQEVVLNNFKSSFNESDKDILGISNSDVLKLCVI
jgi:hypothetical protein